MSFSADLAHAYLHEGFSVVADPTFTTSEELAADPLFNWVQEGVTAEGAQVVADAVAAAYLVGASRPDHAEQLRTAILNGTAVDYGGAPDVDDAENALSIENVIAAARRATQMYDSIHATPQPVLEVFTASDDPLLTDLFTTPPANLPTVPEFIQNSVWSPFVISAEPSPLRVHCNDVELPLSVLHGAVLENKDRLRLMLYAATLDTAAGAITNRSNWGKMFGTEHSGPGTNPEVELMKRDNGSTCGVVRSLGDLGLVLATLEAAQDVTILANVTAVPYDSLKQLPLQ